MRRVYSAGYGCICPRRALDYVDREMLLDVSAQPLMDKYATRPLDFDPGTRWSYSNTNFTVLGTTRRSR